MNAVFTYILNTISRTVSNTITCINVVFGGNTRMQKHYVYVEESTEFRFRKR